ncbi:MAG: hypothetical protein ACFE8O_08860 [Candidatus Hermodarchaeota archaeon]
MARSLKISTALLLILFFTCFAIYPISSANLDEAAPLNSKKSPPPPPYGGGIPVGEYRGTGSSTAVDTRYNKTMSTKTETTDFTDFSIQVPSNWETFINVTVEDITADYPVILDIETNDTSVDGYPLFLQEPYMSFRVTNSCYLHSLQSYINRLVVRIGADARIWIYNASNSGGTPRPNQAIYLLPENVEFGAAAISWINYTFSSLVLLNTSETYDHTFFVNWENQGSAQAAWGYRNDTLSPPDNGYVWLGPAHTPGFDLMMNVSLLPLGQYPTPQQIEMNINGSPVNDVGTNAGWWENSFVEATSTAVFDVTATWPITFNYTYYARFNQTLIGATTFRTDYSFALANWNTTTFLTFPDVNADSNSRTINFSLPAYWEAQFLFNGTTQVPFSRYEDNSTRPGLPGWLFIDEPSGAGNGTSWHVVSIDSNYVQTPTIWRGPADVTGTEVNLNDTLYVTAQLFTFTDGLGRFNPYNETDESPFESLQSPSGSGLLNFTPFSPVAWGIGNITMRCEVVWNNSYHAGVGLSSVTLVYPTTVSGDPDAYTRLIGDNVIIVVYFEDAYSSIGVENAVVNVTFGGTTYPLNDAGAGYYYNTLNTGTMGLTRGIHTGVVLADRLGYASATTNLTLTLWSKTQLVANWTMLTINYTESVTLEVNYSVLTPLGEGGITGADVNITDGSFFSVLFEEGGGNYSVVLDGTVLDVGTHNLIVNASKSGQYLQNNSLMITLIVQGEPTTITGSAPPSINGGEAFNVTVTYEKQSDGTGIWGATISCLLNDTPFAQFVSFDLGNGTYHVQFVLNTSISDSLYNITLRVARSGYNTQYFEVLVDVLIRSTTSSTQILSSSPVVYDNDFIIRVTYTDLFAQALVGAVVDGNWSTINVVDNLDGTYTVRCITTGVSVGWWTISFNISIENYEVQYFSETFHLVWATSLTPENGDYTPTEYENETLILDVTYTNTNTGLGIDSANVWAVTVWASHPMSALGNGVYRLTLNLTGANPNTYAIVVYAQLSNHENQTLNLSLDVLAKHDPILTIHFVPPIYPGTETYITTSLLYANSTPIIGAHVDVEVWIEYANGSILVLTAETVTTDEFGNGIVFIQILSCSAEDWMDGNNGPVLWASATFAGSREIALNSTIASQALSPLMPWWVELLIALLPFIIILIVIIIIGWTYYAKRVRPRKQAQQLALEEKGGMWAQRLMGIMDLRALFVMYAKTGLPIFTYDFAGGEMPSALLSGFISAVNSFYGELSGDADRESQLRDVHYKDLHLSLREGQNVVSVLILDASPTEELTESLANFTAQFVSHYATELESFDGRIDVFDSASEIVERSFHGELLIAYECAEPPRRGFTRKIYDLAINISSTKGRVYIPQLFVAAIEKFGSKKKYNIANALQQLLKAGCLVPLQESSIPTESTSEEAADSSNLFY